MKKQKILTNGGVKVTLVREDGSKVLDETGKTACFDYACIYDNCIVVCDNEKYSILDANANVIDENLDIVSKFNRQFIFTKRNGEKWYAYDTSTNTFVMEFSRLNNIRSGFAEICKDGRTITLDAKLKPVDMPEEQISALRNIFEDENNFFDLKKDWLLDNRFKQEALFVLEQKLNLNIHHANGNTDKQEYEFRKAGNMWAKCRDFCETYAVKRKL